MSLPDYYRILGVSHTASARELKTAYRRLARRYHPDLHPDNPRAEEVLKIVNQAYDVLSDAQQRRQYDAQTLSREYPQSTTGNAPPHPATPVHPKSTRPYPDFTPRRASRSNSRTPTLHLKMVFLMWGLGLLVVFGFVALFHRGPAVPIRNNAWPPIELILRTPKQALLFASSNGKLSSEEDYVQKFFLTTGEKMVLHYRAQANQGRVFIGVKGQTREPGGAAPFADGEWIGRSGTGTIEVLIPREDTYVIFLNLDNFAGTILVNPERE